MSELADRIRKSLSDDPNIAEVRMFGGLCFMLNGNMLVCAMRDGSLLARIGKEQLSVALKKSGVAQMVMSGRQMKDYVVIHGGELTSAALKSWIAMATTFVGPMPEKVKTPRKRG